MEPLEFQEPCLLGGEVFAPPVKEVRFINNGDTAGANRSQNTRDNDTLIAA